MHEAALSMAALPAPAVVLGMVLRPFSLGHELLLNRAGSPLSLSAGPGVANIQRHELAAAVLVCLKTWREVVSPRPDWLLPCKMAMWRRRTRNLLLEQEIAAFRAYRITGCLSFRSSEIQRPGTTYGRSPGCPFILTLHEFLVTECHLTDEAAWDHPLGFAKMRWQCRMENLDRIELYNEEEAEFDAYCAREEAKMKEATCPV